MLVLQNHHILCGVFRIVGPLLFEEMVNLNCIWWILIPFFSELTEEGKRIVTSCRRMLWSTQQTSHCLS